MPRITFTLLLSLSLSPLSALADGPKDNIPTDVRPIPPLGIEIPEEEQNSLQTGLKELRQAIDQAAQTQAKHPQLHLLLPDIEIYHKAVDWAIRYREIHKAPELKAAHEALATGLQRAQQFTRGQTPWLHAKGLVVRGYRSRIDDSVQPYGMVIPHSYNHQPSRLDTWFHGRGETLSELAFIDQRSKQQGQISPDHTLVIHPYGRYSCANKFAGEIDLLEAIDHANHFYRIDSDRIIVRGFSMGGAAAWQFGIHYTDRWCALSPGAGFSETPEFLSSFQQEDVSAAPWYQQKLWTWYNATDSALNLFHLPTIAYSGELDRQKQAADIMEKAMQSEQLELLHIIGPQTEHKLHPDSLTEIEQRLAQIAAAGRTRMPYEVHLNTWTLRYNRMHWITLDSLKEHWERSRIHAQITSPNAIKIRTQNITAFTINMAAGHCPLHPMERPVLTINNQALSVRRPKSDRSWLVHLRLNAQNQWTETLSPTPEPATATQLHKKHQLQGPIDDAFMDRFIFVLPSADSQHPAIQQWIQAEARRAQLEWRKQFRGDAIIRTDSEITEEDIATANLILWGDPASNSLLKKVLPQLPIQWSTETLTANQTQHPANTHLPALIYPNPLNPERYLVINSSFTYREYAYLNNARQIPMLPDWAIIDTTQPPNAVHPGRIADAGFFDETWQWKPAPPANQK